MGSAGGSIQKNDLGSVGFFTLNVNKSAAQKLRRIILLHGELITFSVLFPKIRKVFVFMMFGASGNVHGTQIPLFLTLDTPRLFKK